MNLEGQTFGLLTVVLKQRQHRVGPARYLCRCVCGTDVTVRGTSLTTGNTRSCGASPCKQKLKNESQGIRVSTEFIDSL